MMLDDLKTDKIKIGDKETSLFIESLFNDTKKKYLKLHRDWYVNERFVRGDHWIVFNKTLNKIQVIPTMSGEIRRVVNKIRTQIRSIKNFIKRSQPRWEVHPDGATDEALNEAIKKNKILQHYYRTLQFPLLLTDVIVGGLKYSLGILEGGIIKEGKKNKIKFWYDDTFDIYFDPFASDIQSCRFIFKAFKKPLSSVKNNKNYTIKGELRPSTDESELDYKKMLDDEKYGYNVPSERQDLEEIIVKEMWIKWMDENGQNHVKIFTVAGGQLIRIFSPKYRRYPLFGYNPERAGGAIYSDPWIKDLISLNKSLDKSTSQIEGYIQKMLAGKYLIKQGVEVSSITDKGAEKIYYKGSVAPKHLDLQPLPSTAFQHLGNCEKWIEEGGGAREATLGRAPGGIQSGKGVEALQAADALMVAEPIENLEKFLEEVGEFVLELIEDYTIVSETIVEDKEEIKFIGAREGGDMENTLKVKSAPVKVAIVPEIAYGEDVKFQRMMELAQMGLVDQQTVLEKLAVSNVGDIIERVRKEKEEEFKKEMVKQRESHRTSGEGPEDSADLADQENMQLASKQRVPLTPRALWAPEHTQLHLAFIQENMDAYQQNQQAFDEHIGNEEAYAQEGKQQPQQMM